LSQPKLGAETYSSLKGVVAESDELNPSDLGVKVILPSSFGGSPRHMAALYQDAMAVVRYFGKPDLFITMTCNPNWPEIKDNLFPGQIGENGWTTDIPFRNNRVAGPADREQYGVQRDQAAVARERQENPDTGRGGCKHVTAAMFHSYYLHDRRGVKSILLRAGRLFQEWIVDAAAVNEQNKLRWISENQPKLRAETYSSFKGVVADGDDLNPSDLGVKVILPSSFGGSPRHMAALYQDAMAVVRYFGKPDLFITMTCNPNWPEIKDNLFKGQITSDRPDLVSRVFELKLQELMSDIRKREIFGPVRAFIYVIEFQNRGLPHAHIMSLRRSGQIKRFLHISPPENTPAVLIQSTSDRCRPALSMPN
jgi:hypothetical protein